MFWPEFGLGRTAWQVDGGNRNPEVGRSRYRTPVVGPGIALDAHCTDRYHSQYSAIEGPR